MAIQTINATILMRIGLEQDLDADQMTPGEWAVSKDTKYVRMCFAPGIVIRMATYEAFEQDMQEIQTILATCQEIQTAVDAMAALAERHKEDAKNYAKLSESFARGDTGVRVGENTDNSMYWSRQAKSEADRAKNEADRASSIAGLDIDSELSETSTNPVQNKVITKALNEIDIDISSKPVEFLEASERINIESGETIPTLFGKIKKWLSELKTLAFTAEYSDISNAPVIVESTEITEPGFLMDGKTASEALKGLKGVLIWSNPDPSVAFAPQSITLNNEYNRYKIYYRPTITSSRLQVAECAFGCGTFLNYSGTQTSGAPYVVSRSVTLNPNILGFGIGTFQSVSNASYIENNNRCVPAFIVGCPN